MSARRPAAAAAADNDQLTEEEMSAYEVKISLGDAVGMKFALDDVVVETLAARFDEDNSTINISNVFGLFGCLMGAATWTIFEFPAYKKTLMFVICAYFLANVIFTKLMTSRKDAVFVSRLQNYTSFLARTRLEAEEYQVIITRRGPKGETINEETGTVALAALFDKQGVLNKRVLSEEVMRVVRTAEGSRDKRD